MKILRRAIPAWTLMAITGVWSAGATRNRARSEALVRDSEFPCIAPFPRVTEPPL